MNTIFGLFVLGTIYAVVWGLLVAFPFMLLWNWCLVPAIPGVGEIGFLQAWGLYILTNLMFKTTVTKKD